MAAQAQQLALSDNQSHRNLFEAHGYKPQLTRKMVSQLEAASTHEDCLKLPVLGDDDRASVVMELDAMGALSKPASAENIAQILAPLSNLRRKREGGDEARFNLNVMQSALADMPAWALKRAVLEIIQNDDWFPTVARIRRAADVHIGKARWRKYQLNQWLAKRARVRLVAKDEPPITDAEIVAMPVHCIRMGIPRVFSKERVLQAFRAMRLALPESELQ